MAHTSHRILQHSFVSEKLVTEDRRLQHYFDVEEPDRVLQFFQKKARMQAMFLQALHLAAAIDPYVDPSEIARVKAPSMREATPVAQALSAFLGFLFRSGHQTAKHDSPESVTATNTVLAALHGDTREIKCLRKVVEVVRDRDAWSKLTKVPVLLTM